MRLPLLLTALLALASCAPALPDLAAATKIWRPLFATEADVYNGGLKLMRDGWAAAR